MSQYLVELSGEVREVYVVEADSSEEAEANWMNGFLQVQESSGMGVVKVEIEEG